MRDEGKGSQVFSLWVNWESRVISFSPEAGFEELQYSSREDMLRFAVKRSNEGFAIQ